VREAELRVRGRRSPRARAAVVVDPVRWCRRTVGRQLAAAEVEKVRRELARHGEFTAISEQIAEVNEKICEARPVAGTSARPVPDGEKGGSARRSRGRKPPR